MKYRKWSVSMRMKIMLLCTVSTLLALIVQTLFFQYQSSKQIYSQARDASFNSMRNMQEDVSNFIKQTEDNMASVYQQKNFIDDLAGSMPVSTLTDRYGNEINYNVAHHLAISAFDASFNVKALYIYNNDNKLISLYRASYSPKYSYPGDIFNNSEGSNADIVKDYIKSNKKEMLVSSYFNDNRKEDLVRFVFKIFYKNATRTIGYMVCDIDQKSLNKIIKKYVYSDDQIVWLQCKGDRPIIKVGNPTQKQKVYYDHTVDLVLKNSPQIKSNGATEDSEFFSIPNNRYSFIAFCLTPQRLLEVNQQVLTRNLLIIALTLLFAFALSSILLARGITTPLTNMVETMKKIKKGNTSLRVEYCRNDEIGELGENFNNMLDTIEGLIFEEYQSQLAMNNAKFKALQAQVNPHFLYNTLDTMSGIATSQNCHTVSTLCKALSNIFRYSLDMKNPLAAIEDEIKHLKNYMYVMNVRENNAINYQIDIDNRLLKKNIPRISIQPLVENSLQHGLRHKHGDKRIWIKGVLDKDNIVISVIDNGIGMDAELINSSLDSSNSDVLDKESSIGLNNINTRVKLLFGNDYGIKVYSKNGEGSNVSLYIPHIKNDSEAEESLT